MEMIKAAAFKTDWGWIGVLATVHGIAAVTLPCRNRHAAEEQLRKARPVPIHFAQRGGGDRHVQAAAQCNARVPIVMPPLNPIKTIDPSVRCRQANHRT